MYTRKFFLHIIIRIALILATCIAIAYINIYKERWFTTIGLLVVLIIQLAELIGYILRVGNTVSSYIISLKNNDLSVPNAFKQSGLINQQVVEGIKELQQRVSYIKNEQIIQALFIENLLQNIEIGIIAILPNGKLKFKNEAVTRLLNIKSISSLETIKISHPEFYNSLISIKPGEDKLLSLHNNNEVRKISIKATRFISKGEDITLIFFQDIKNEIDESLLQSWQNLIRILTHEINNTVSPIASLADSLAIYLSMDGDRKEPLAINEINQKVINNSLEGLNIIKERSSGLIDFVSKYKSLLPKKTLNIATIEVGQLFYRLKILFSEKIENKRITFLTTLSTEDLTIKADQHYLEQVLINLIGNSIDAFDGFTPAINPQIELKSFKGDNSETIIQVIDNGIGISQENLDKVFIPFYSTKEKGTGIGLSLSMQIVRLHSGSLSVSSKEGEKTSFTIKI